MLVKGLSLLSEVWGDSSQQPGLYIGLCEVPSFLLICFLRKVVLPFLHFEKSFTFKYIFSYKERKLNRGISVLKWNKKHGLICGGFFVLNKVSQQ